MPSGVLLKLSFGLSRAMLSRNSVSLVSNASQFSSRRSLARTSMAASCSKAVFGDVHIDDLIATCGNGLEFPKSSGVFFYDRSRSSCVKASVKMRNGELPKSHLVCGNAIRKNGNTNNLVLGPILKNLYSSSSVSVSGRAQDVSSDGNFSEEQLVDSTAVSGLNLKLLSGSCYLPHPDKEETGGEDAHFICEDEQAIGIADGVGGWADVGVNAGLFSRELMSHSVNAIQEECNGSIDPSRVLEKAHANMKARGSSTACIIVLKSEGLHAINLGDSGFMVVRDGCTIFESPVQQHGFNFTYQLESGNGGDLPSSGQVFTIPVAPGDVIIAGTDGLFDNLYNNEVTAVVVHAIRTGLGPEATAQKIAALARQRALDTNRQTPFSTAAQDAGYRYYGGKLDDITVVVSWYKDIGLEHAASRPLLKTVFQVTKRLFKPRKRTLLFVLRDHSKTPFEYLETALKEDIDRIWASVAEPETSRSVVLSDFFNVEIAALSSYEFEEKNFKEQVAFTLRIETYK